MSVRISNRLKLHKNLEGDRYSKIYTILQTIIPNYNRIYSSNYLSHVLQYDNSEDLNIFDAGYGSIVKINEVLSGVWIIQFLFDKTLYNGHKVLYLFEPKSNKILYIS